MIHKLYKKHLEQGQCIVLLLKLMIITNKSRPYEYIMI